MTQPLYHDTPASDKSIVPTPAPSNGTIYMYGVSYQLLDKSTDVMVKPSAMHGYFAKKETCLSNAVEWLSIDNQSQLCATLYGGRCEVYQITSSAKEPLYIYVWAISPAGGGA